MTIWTSRYSNKTLSARGDLVAVGITVGHPRFKLGYELAARFPQLGPTRAMFSLDRPEFEEQMRSRLDALGIDGVYGLLRSVAKPAQRGHRRDVVLLCFEDIRPPRTPDVWCHRETVAAWLEEQTGEPVLELEDAGPRPRKRAGGWTGGAANTSPPLALFPSRSNPDAEPYAVRAAKGGHLYCSCPAYRFRKRCRHLVLAIEGLAA